MMINTRDILNILPQNIKQALGDIGDFKGLQEIRIRADKPITAYDGNRELVKDYVPTSEDLKAVLQRMSNYSIYAFDEEIKQGFITIKGGHRVGICGSCVVENNKIKTIKSISSLNIRICREIAKCSNPIMKYVIDGNNIINTIIISPPKCGKTTLIRDMSRNISDGMSELGFKGKKVCIVDERSEIAACFNGIPQLNVGSRTDVLDSCPKSEGIMMAIRSMSPDVLICDEIGTYSDVNSIIMALNSGVSLITTIHGFGIEDLYKRDVFKDILNNIVFARAIILSAREGAGTIESIYDFTSKDELWRR
jgi:stage III sporulation protein AA